VRQQNSEVAVLVEPARIEQFHLGFVLASPSILFEQPGVGEFRLRILVQIFHVRVCRRAIQIKGVFLYVLAMIAFIACQTEQPFLKDGVTLIPERNCETDELVPIGDARQSILVPAIRAGASVVVWKEVPGKAVRAVVLADGSPRTFAKVWAPAFPVLRPRIRFG